MDINKISRIVAEQPPADNAVADSSTAFAMTGKITATQTYHVGLIRVGNGIANLRLLRTWNAQSNMVTVFLTLEWAPDADSPERSVVIDLDYATEILHVIGVLEERRGPVVQAADTPTNVTYEGKNGFSMGFHVGPNGVRDYMLIEGEFVHLPSFDSLASVLRKGMSQAEKQKARTGI